MFVISNNHVLIVDQKGGGIYLYHSRLNIQGRCKILENVAREGGGIYGDSSTITLEDVQNSDSPSPLSSSSLFLGFNSAKLGGALCLVSTQKFIPYLLLHLSIK